MPLLIILLLICAVMAFGPQLWVRRTMAQHAADRPDLPGTGGELARHLLDEAGLHNIGVESTPSGNHYDPTTRVVRLTPENHDGRSITAVAVAAHEVSHALQHSAGDRLLAGRVTLARWVQRVERANLVQMLLAPLAMAFSPRLILLQIAIAVAVLGSRLVLHLVTLPVEFDASFGRALPILERGRYLQSVDLPAARSVLRAAALTYVAAALATLLDATRLIRAFRV